ncbi:MAG: uracil phosphoribosyltransferase [Actinobacteria bacterium]|nr:MAG: uracil phosphoribosyltransferase [Actinomycetota bacterium]TML69667.1 MAG: uracil phosphoribosyltransferase [Actinomycetota bacterium]
MTTADTSTTSQVTVVTHPLVQHKLGLLRDVTTTTQMFRQLVNELTLLLTYEATKDLADEEIEIETPLEWTRGRRISGKKVAVCPILRAGVGMLDAVLSLVPGARVGFIGLFRDEETLQPVEYYVKLPGDIADRDVILLDPMLATGNSTAAAIETVQRVGATSVRLIALIAAPEGIARVHRDHPEVPIVVAAIDRELNDIGYILPGLGDAGDRLYGTK